MPWRLCVRSILHAVGDARNAILEERDIEIELSKPNRLFANRRCVNSCFLGTGTTASTDLISTITLSSTIRSARNPVSIRALG